MRRLVSLLTVTAVLALGVVLGLWSARAALDEGDGFAPVRLAAARVGVWEVRRREGTPEADPYARAADARSGTLPLASGEGLRLTARADRDGRPLDGGCAYALAGGALPARAWSLALHGSDGRPVPNPAGRTAFTSAEVLRREDGSFRVAVAAEASPGDWLPAPATGPFVLTLRLYDAPLGAGALPAEDALPSLTRVGCGP